MRRKTHLSEWLGILKSLLVWGGVVACAFVLVLQHSHLAPTRLPRLVRLVSSRPSPRDSRSLLLLPASARQTGATCDVTNVSLITSRNVLQSNYSGAIDDMDPDVNIIRLNKDLSSIEEALRATMQPYKFR